MELHPRQKRIIEFLGAWAEPYQPSMRDIADSLELSISVVKHHLDMLQKKGLVKREPNISRSIHLVKDNGNATD